MIYLFETFNTIYNLSIIINFINYNNTYIMTLHLNLKKKWFDMILSGEKKEEYREIKKYWTVRFKDFLINNPFDTITFKNGYSKNARTIIIELIKIDFGTSKYKWSDKNVKCYVLYLGNILETHNI